MALPEPPPDNDVLRDLVRAGYVNRALIAAIILRSRSLSGSIARLLVTGVGGVIALHRAGVI